MLDRVMATFALLVLAGFLGILLWEVPRWDLGAVIVATMALALWDYYTSSWRDNGDR